MLSYCHAPGGKIGVDTDVELILSQKKESNRDKQKTNVGWRVTYPPGGGDLCDATGTNTDALIVKPRKIIRRIFVLYFI